MKSMSRQDDHSQRRRVGIAGGHGDVQLRPRPGEFCGQRQRDGE